MTSSATPASNRRGAVFLDRDNTLNVDHGYPWRIEDFAEVSRAPAPCREPEPGMFLELAGRWTIDLSALVMIGDRNSDVAAGKAAGCHAYLFDGCDLATLAKQALTRHFSSRRAAPDA